MELQAKIYETIVKQGIPWENLAIALVNQRVNGSLDQLINTAFWTTSGILVGKFGVQGFLNLSSEQAHLDESIVPNLDLIDESLERNSRVSNITGVLGGISGFFFSLAQTT